MTVSTLRKRRRNPRRRYHPACTSTLSIVLSTTGTVCSSAQWSERFSFQPPRAKRPGGLRSPPKAVSSEVGPVRLKKTRQKREIQRMRNTAHFRAHDCARPSASEMTAMTCSCRDRCRFGGLTGAEARLAAELGEGTRVEQIAQTFGISRETVRSQLKAIFSKTGVHRQVELVSLLNSSRIDVSTRDRLAIKHAPQPGISARPDWPTSVAPDMIQELITY